MSSIRIEENGVFVDNVLRFPGKIVSHTNNGENGYSIILEDGRSVYIKFDPETGQIHVNEEDHGMASYTL